MGHRFRRLSTFITTGLIVVCGQLAGTPVFAETAQAQAITVSPASTQLTIDPGASISKSIDIINNGDEAFTVKTSVLPYYVTSDTYDPHFTQLPGTVDASAWVHLSPVTPNLEGHKQVTVPYTVTVPVGTVPGGYYAVIFAETDTNNENSGVISHNRVGNILYITVNGEIKNSGSITGNALPSVGFSGYPLTITSKVSNSGGTHFITTAIVTVTDINDKPVFTSTTERYVLPQTEREITSQWTPQALFGIFTIHRSATIAGVTKTLPDEKTVIVNPWALILITFLIGLLTAVVVNRARHRRHAHEK